MDISASTIVAIPLDDLRDSPLNARTIDSKSIEELAASIHAEGLLQNLTVLEAADGLYEVIAGKSRLKALKLLRERDQLPTELLSVPCRIVDEQRAQSASLAENVVREAMHPADEYEAFSRLAKAGKSAEDIAAEFGVLPLVVQRRLRLASVAPSLFALFRTGEIQLDQMMALAITEDHAAQEAAWNAKGRNDAHALRERLTRTEFSITRDKAAKFVGADALREAGVIIRGDLFSDDGEGYTDDRRLVDELALAKLEVKLERVRKEGWSWAEAQIDFKEYDGKFGTLYPEEGKHFSKKQLANAGAIVTIDYDGKSQTHRGLVKGGHKAAAAVHSGKADPNTGKVANGVSKPNISESVIRRLTAQRTAILQGALLTQPARALVVLVHALLVQHAYTASGITRASRIAFAGPGPLEQLADDLPGSRHYAIMKERTKALQESLPNATQLWTWLQDQPEATIHSLLAWCTAMSLDVVDRNGADKGSHALTNELCQFIGVNFADHWEPGAETFLKHVPRVVISETVTEVCGVAEAAKLEHLNKAQIVDAAEHLLAGKGWLPKVMRMKSAPLPAESGAIAGSVKGKPKPAAKAPAKPAPKPSAKKKRPAPKPAAAKKPAAKKTTKRK